MSCLNGVGRHRVAAPGRAHDRAFEPIALRVGAYPAFIDVGVPHQPAYHGGLSGHIAGHGCAHLDGDMATAAPRDTEMACLGLARIRNVEEPSSIARAGAAK